MTLLPKYIKEWYLQRQTEKRRRQYQAGFNWAAGVLLREEMSALEVQTYYEIILTTQIDDFELGARDCTDLLCIDKKVIEDNRIYRTNKHLESL